MRIGLLCEGLIDLQLVPPLLQTIARTRADVRWPIQHFNAVEQIGIRTGSFGQIPKAVRKLVHLINLPPWSECEFFVILLDHRTRTTQKEIRRLIRGHSKFVVGIAIREIEAWWLGDRANTLGWLRLAEHSLAGLRYGRAGYRAESDDAPKRTLDELTIHSSDCLAQYGKGNLQLAIDFANVWRNSADLNQIEAQCPIGFRPFCRDSLNEFRAARRRLLRRRHPRR